MNSTLYSFQIELADADREVYERLALRVALHPSETAEHLWSRVLAYCLEYGPGIEMSPGLCDGDAPALWVRDASGRVLSWIDVGAPDAERLHKAAKAAERVAVYTHKPRATARQLAGKSIHRGDEIVIVELDAALIEALVQRLERRVTLQLAVSGGHLYLDLAGESLTAVLRETRVGD